LSRGFDDGDTFSLDLTISEFILPRLIRFNELRIGYPFGMSEEEWDTIIQKMIRGFELHVDSLPSLTDKEVNEMNEGLDLFRKYYQNLWW